MNSNGGGDGIVIVAGLTSDDDTVFCRFRAGPSADVNSDMDSCDCVARLIDNADAAAESSAGTVDVLDVEIVAALLDALNVRRSTSCS